MINITYADGKQEKELLKVLKKRSAEADVKVTQIVSEIIENVKTNADSAVLEYTKKFDGVIPQKIKYTKDELKRFVEECSPEFVEALERAAKNIEEYHKMQKQYGFVDTRPDGVILGQRVRALKRVGIYVPGGTAAYPSSVLMNAIPAKIAGVEEIIMVTPPSKTGGENCVILAAAYIAGVDSVYMVGGAQAVAALAFGTETIPKVDKIVGPGNIYVATAKKLLYGVVDIDMIAGPSEILIIADSTANPKFIAADLMSQAEHDELASSILVATDEEIAKATIKELKIQVERLSRKEIIKKSLVDFGAIIVCGSIDKAFEIANEIAPEHLEICVENPLKYIGRADNAGSVFLGNYSPEALGDYYAGPNHVLPTSGTARFFSPLSVDSFIKKSSYIYYPEKAFKAAAKDIINIALQEGLTAHANSVEVRL